MVMKAPVWHLISRIRIFSGSTGYQRYRIIDTAIKHYDEWILFGLGQDRNLERWGWGLHDFSNHYLFEGIFGGGITLLVFIIVLIYAIKIMGTFSVECNNRIYALLSWGICVSILGHCVAFLGIIYFTQMKMVLYLAFAIVGFTCDQVNKKVLVKL
jgi:hypothetical protein